MSGITESPRLPRPLVGITGRRFRLGLIASADPRYGDRCTDAYMSDFAIRIARAGGLPVHLSYDTDPVAMCDWLGGLIVTGGQDMRPELWGGAPTASRDVDPRGDTMAYDSDRDAYEIDLVRVAIDRGIPVLGVCRGLQILNVARGGTLIADLPPGPVQHLSERAALSDGGDDHVVSFEPGSLAQAVFGDHAVTNSWHHQAVDRCGDGLTVTGRTPDGVVEAIELPGAPVLGVQWHPEWMERDDCSMRWVVEAAERRQVNWAPHRHTLTVTH